MKSITIKDIDESKFLSIKDVLNNILGIKMRKFLRVGLEPFTRTKYFSSLPWGAVAHAYLVQASDSELEWIDDMILTHGMDFSKNNSDKNISNIIRGYKMARHSDIPVKDELRYLFCYMNQELIISTCPDFFRDYK